MSTASVSRPRRSGGGDSNVLAHVVAVLLGLAVVVLGFFALVMWMDARDARDDPRAAPRSSDLGTHTNHNVALPLNSFAGVVPENAAELAEAHVATPAALPAIPAGDVVKVQMTLKDMVARSLRASSTTPGPSTATARQVPPCTCVRGRRWR